MTHYVLAGLLVVTEVYYWFVYFPRAWKNGSNREINDIRETARFMNDYYLR